MTLVIILGFIFGILVGSLFTVTLGLSLAVALLAVICFMYRYYVATEHQRVLTLTSIFILCALCGMGRIFISSIYSYSELSEFENQNIVAEGVVVTEPDVRESRTQLTIRIDSVAVASNTVSFSENILVSVPLYPEFSYGDKVSVNTTLHIPKDIDSGDGRIFDYKNYLRVRGIWYVGERAKVIYVESGFGNPVKKVLFTIKKTFTESISRAIPPPESSLLSGLLIGSKQSLGKDLLEKFSQTGVSHIVVLSGYNIAIVAESIMAILVFLPAATSFFVGCASIILFTILSGGGASGVRAAIMVLVALYARRSNREYVVSRAFGFAVVLMLALSPALLVFDPSFQLSVLATIGIVFVSPIITPYFSRTIHLCAFKLNPFSKTISRFLKNKALGEIISSTVATQLTVLPFLIYNTGTLSLVSLPVNILILGTIPLTMLLGFITGIFGLFSVYLSFVPGIFAYVLLRYQLAVVDSASRVPFGYVHLPAFSFVMVFGLYLLIFIGLYFIQKRKS